MINFEKASSASRLTFSKFFQIIPDFESTQAQATLVDECKRALLKASWCRDHFDKVITNYREISVSNCELRYPAIFSLWNRIRVESLLNQSPPAMMNPHILELASNGHIDYHIDTVRIFTIYIFMKYLFL